MLRGYTETFPNSSVDIERGEMRKVKYFGRTSQETTQNERNEV